MYPKPLQQLIEQFKKLPSVGNKTAERYALQILNMSNESVQELTQALIDTKQLIKFCETCGNYTTDSYCEICEDDSRNRSLLCVVSTPKEILAIEKLGTYHGLYHVLGGLISPTNQVMPEDLAIESLIKRVKEKEIQEVILALSPTMEGETTAYYLAKKLEGLAEVTALAQGLPMGGNLEYVDDLTLTRSFNNRKKYDI